MFVQEYFSFEPDTYIPVQYENYEELIISDRRFYRCTFSNCGKMFKYKSEVNRHKSAHFNDRPYHCSYEGCKKSFKRSDALDIHMRIHTKETPFECTIPGCGQKFITKAALKYHLAKHNNDRTYKCTFPKCNRSFLTYGQLKQHQKSYKYHYNIGSTLSEELLEETQDQFIGFETMNFESLSSSPISFDTFDNFLFETSDSAEECCNDKNTREIVDLLKRIKTVENTFEFQNSFSSNFREQDSLEFDGGQIWSELKTQISFDENESQLIQFLKESSTNGF